MIVIFTMDYSGGSIAKYGRKKIFRNIHLINSLYLHYIHDLINESGPLTLILVEPGIEQGTFIVWIGAQREWKHS